MTRVSLSSGEFFFVDAPLEDVADLLYRWPGPNVIAMLVGGRYVNPLQVAQITFEEMSTIYTPERLEAADGAVR